MNNRICNFSGGPGALSAAVRVQAKEAVRALPDTGISVLSLNHRSSQCRKILDEAEERLRLLLGIPNDYRVLFLPGGGTLQFSLVPMTMLNPASTGD